MKQIFLLIVPCLLFSSCWGRPGSDTGEMDSRETEYDQGTYEYHTDALSDGRKENFDASGSVKVHHLKDARTGLIVNSAEYPTAWRVISKPSYSIDQKLPTFLIQITGPHGLKSFNTPMRYHVYYQDPQMAQVMNSTAYGRLVRPLTDPQQIFKEEVRDRMVNSGYRYIGNREQPEVDRFIKNRLSAEAKMDVGLKNLNTEWENHSGQKALVSISRTSIEQPTVSGNMILWFYSITYTFVDQGAYEASLEALKKSTFSYMENPQWQHYVQMLSQQRAQQAAERSRLAAMDHQNRMNARWAAFNAHQEKMKGIWAAQDANHASFMNRNFGAGSDTGQRQFLNMINEQETVYNPTTGNTYQVNAGSTEYWMDSDGNYIQNDDLFYTPNGDINLDNREWVKVGRAY